MDDVQETTVTRKEIGIRFLYSLLYIVVFESMITKSGWNSNILIP